jgi:hypothetical protein
MCLLKNATFTYFVKVWKWMNHPCPTLDCRLSTPDHHLPTLDLRLSTNPAPPHTVSAPVELT